MAEEGSLRQTLYQYVADKVEFAKTKVEELRQSLRDFDTKNLTTEKATAYFGRALDQTQEALTDLGKQAQALKENATEIPVRAFSSAFARAGEALADVKEKAHSFDEKHALSNTITDLVNKPREQANVAIASASSYVTEAAHAAYEQLQGVSDGIKLRVVAATETGIDKVIPAAAAYDEKHHISEKAGVAKDVIVAQLKQFDQTYHVADKVMDLNKRWGISEHFVSALSGAASLDQRITGGKVEPVVLSAYEKGLQMAGYLKAKYDDCRQKGADGAPAVEGAESTPAVAPPADVPPAAEPKKADPPAPVKEAKPAPPKAEAPVPAPPKAEEPAAQEKAGEA